ncbi:MAG: lysophospholipid acyltransferase family protein [Caulobacterales bacterium]
MSAPRPKWLQDLIWRLQALGMDVGFAVLRLTPVDTASDFAGWLFRTLGPRTGVHKVVLRNIAIAFPDWDDARRGRLALDQWDNTGRVLMELPFMDRIVADPTRVEVVGAERLEAIAEGGRPAVIVTGHFSNWEVMAWAIVSAGVECEITYRAANNPYADKRIRDMRYRYGVRLFAPKGAKGAREQLDALKRGVSVAMLNDQKYEPGVEASFFGRAAPTNPAAVRLAMRFGVPLQPLSVQRTRGARFKVIVHEPIEVAKTGSRAVDVEAGVRQVNAFIEARVRERPEEWWWVHRRFPAAVYRD